MLAIISNKTKYLKNTDVKMAKTTMNKGFSDEKGRKIRAKQNVQNV